VARTAQAMSGYKACFVAEAESWAAEARGAGDVGAPPFVMRMHVAGLREAAMRLDPPRQQLARGAFDAALALGSDNARLAACNEAFVATALEACKV